MPNALSRCFYCFNIKLTLIFLLLLVFNARSQPITARFETSKEERKFQVEKVLPLIDSLYKRHAAKNGFPALSYGVVLDGNLIASNALGVSNIPTGTPATTTSCFRIASMTKSFTALAILILRDKGKLRLDDPVYKYIPAFKNQKPLTTDAPVITVRHLLTHSAGFPEDNPWGDRQLQDSEKDLDNLIQRRISLSTAPGTSYEYSNLGYALLGRIITTVSEMPYHMFITNNILKPLGMNHTYWEVDDVNKNQLVYGYRFENGAFKEETMLHHGSFGAMGGLITSIEDFSKYMALQMDAWPPRNEKENGIVKRSSLREMQQPWMFNNLNTSFKFLFGKPCATASAYGYGLRWIKDCSNKTFVGHAGGLPGFGSNWTILPEFGIGVVCFSNLTYAPTTAINLQVLDTIVSITGLKPIGYISSNILKQRKEDLLRILPAWDTSRFKLSFAENFFLDNSLDSVRKQSKTLLDKIGKVKETTEIIPENNLRGYFLIKGERGSLKVWFSLTPENPALIQALEMSLLPAE